MTTLPSLFLSHGAPNLALYESPTRDFLSALGASLPRHKAILIASAYFQPCPFAFGAGGPGAKGQRLSRAYVGPIGMDAYAFE
jgi:hypothetical protein